MGFYGKRRVALGLFKWLIPEWWSPFKMPHLRWEGLKCKMIDRVGGIVHTPIVAARTLN